jgi:hypothetical protein
LTGKNNFLGEVGEKPGGAMKFKSRSHDFDLEIGGPARQERRTDDRQLDGEPNISGGLHASLTFAIEKKFAQRAEACRNDAVSSSTSSSARQPAHPAIDFEPDHLRLHVARGS